VLHKAKNVPKKHAQETDMAPYQFIVKEPGKANDAFSKKQNAQCRAELKKPSTLEWV
jgi:hypothetical protein